MFVCVCVCVCVVVFVLVCDQIFVCRMCGCLCVGDVCVSSFEMCVCVCVFVCAFDTEVIWGGQRLLISA